MRLVAPRRNTASRKVMLFGSYARGGADNTSDVDLVIEASAPSGFVRSAIYNELE